MAVEDFLDSHVAVAIAGTAVVLSPRARQVLRRGAIYGVAGALMAGDAIATFARGVADGSRQGTASLASTAPDVPNQVVVGESDAGS